MPTPEKMAKITANRRGKTTEAPKGNTLDDAERQQDIMHPKPTPIRIGKSEFILKPLMAWNSIEFTGLVQQVLAEVYSGQTEVSNPIALMNRTGGIVAERYGKKLVPHIAAATGEPSDERVAEIMDAIEANPDEAYNFLALAFVLLCTQNKSFERISNRGQDSKK